MSEYKARKVLYFEEPGPHNTDKVIQVVRERIKEGGIRYVVVASISGNTALKFAEKLKGSEAMVVCVSGFPGWLNIHGIEYPFVKGKLEKNLRGSMCP